MNIDFRQGIISYPAQGAIQYFMSYDNGQHVSLLADRGPTIVTFAHGKDNYTFEESKTITNAWHISSPAVSVWLYWDLNLLTGERTFGTTTIPPIVSYNTPMTPAIDQHWFDSMNQVMNVYQADGWCTKLRVFAGRLTGGVLLPIGSDQSKFSGSQVGIYAPGAHSNNIVFNNCGYPNRSMGGKLFTDDDRIFRAGAITDHLIFEPTIVTAVASETIAKFQVVQFVSSGKVELALYDNDQLNTVAIAVQPIADGAVGSLCVQGVVKNPQWNWTEVGAKLWVDLTIPGALSTVNPYTLNPGLHETDNPPVARVLTPTSVYFEKGLGGVGVKGQKGSTRYPFATTTVFGFFRLSLAAADPGNPIVVGDNDIRNFNDRYPLPHNQAATTITTHPVGYMTGDTLQANLPIIDDLFVHRSGDVMTGLLTLSSDPVNANHAATKQYVDNQRLGDLYDVLLQSALPKHTIVYTDGQWVNQSLVRSLASLDDVTLTDPIDTGETLKFNGFEWDNESDLSLWTIGPRAAFSGRVAKTNVLQPTHQTPQTTELYSSTNVLINSDTITPFTRPFWTVTESLQNYTQVPTAVSAITSLSDVFTLSSCAAPPTVNSGNSSISAFVTKRHCAGPYGGYISNEQSTGKLVFTIPRPNTNIGTIAALRPMAISHDETTQSVYALFANNDKLPVIAKFDQLLTEVQQFNCHASHFIGGIATDTAKVFLERSGHIVINPLTKNVTVGYVGVTYHSDTELSSSDAHIAQYTHDMGTILWEVYVQMYYGTNWSMCQDVTSGTTYSIGNQRIDAISSTGTVLWSANLPSSIVTGRFVDSCVSSCTGNLYAITVGDANNHSVVVAMDKNGTVKWTKDVGVSYSNVVVNYEPGAMIACDDMVVYAVTQDVHAFDTHTLRLVAINGLTGATLWSRIIESSKYGGHSSDGDYRAHCVMHQASMQITDQAVVMSFWLPDWLTTGSHLGYIPRAQVPGDAPLRPRRQSIISLDKTGPTTGQNSDDYIVSIPGSSANAEWYNNLHPALADNVQWYNTQHFVAPVTLAASGTLITPQIFNQTADLATQMPVFRPDVITIAPGITPRTVMEPSLDVVNIAHIRKLTLDPDKVAPPLLTNPVGTPIDCVGTIRADSSNLHICTGTFDGASTIWKYSPFLPRSLKSWQTGTVTNYPYGDVTNVPGVIRFGLSAAVNHALSTASTTANPTSGSTTAYNELTLMPSFNTFFQPQSLSLLYCSSDAVSLNPAWSYVNEPYVSGMGRMLTLASSGTPLILNGMTKTLRLESTTALMTDIRNSMRVGMNDRGNIKKFVVPSAVTYSLAPPGAIPFWSTSTLNAATELYDNGWTTNLFNAGTGRVDVYVPGYTPTINGVGIFPLYASQEVELVGDGAAYFTKRPKSTPRTYKFIANSTVTPIDALMNCDVYTNYKLILHGNADVRVANVADGDVLTIVVSQGNVTTGIGNVNWPTSFKWGAAGAPTINGIADTTWIVTAIYSIEEGIFLCNCSPGY